MRAGCAVTRRVEHGFENGVKDVDTHGRAVGVLQDRLMMIAVKFVARLRNKKLQGFGKHKKFLYMKIQR
jgi:hypothetical protein